jgi:hypothetical protein
MEYEFQFANDLKRDGLQIELTDKYGNVLAYVLRSDAENSMTFWSESVEIPFVYIEKLVSIARHDLGKFEDGTALPNQI